MPGVRGGFNYQSSNRDSFSNYADDSNSSRSNNFSNRGSSQYNDDQFRPASRGRGTSERSNYSQSSMYGGRDRPSGRNLDDSSNHSYGGRDSFRDQRSQGDPFEQRRPVSSFGGMNAESDGRRSNREPSYANERSYGRPMPAGRGGPPPASLRDDYDNRFPPRQNNPTTFGGRESEPQRFSRNNNYMSSGRDSYSAPRGDRNQMSGGRGGHFANRGSYNQRGGGQGGYPSNPDLYGSSNNINRRPNNEYSNDQYNSDSTYASGNARSTYGSSNRGNYGFEREGGYGGPSGRGGSTHASALRSDHYNDSHNAGRDRFNGYDRQNNGYNNRYSDKPTPYSNSSSRFGDQQSGFSSRYDNFGSGNGSFYDNLPPDVRAPRFYRPAERNVTDIFQEDKEIADTDGSNLEDDADIDVKGGGENRMICETWDSMHLEPQLIENILKAYSRPRKVQQYTIPYVIEGYDCKVQCETGSGKTAAFLVPIVNYIMRINGFTGSSSPIAIIISPTRELCNQLYEQAKKFTHNTGIGVARAYGEYNMRDNMFQIREGCHILCACLGRLLHFIEEGTILLPNVKFIVLDEADRLLTENSSQDVQRFMSWKTLPAKDNRQTLLFSATLEDPAVSSFIRMFLKHEETVEIKAKVTSNRRVEYRIMAVPDVNAKHGGIVKYIKEITVNGIIPRVLIFVNKKRDTDRVASNLTTEGLDATTIHGDRGQHLREEALNRFRSGKCRILVATDVCARGVDIKGLDYVINFDLPNDESTFVQRSGRTGRTHNGIAASFYYENYDKNLAESIVKVMTEAGQEAPNYLFEYVSEDDYKWLKGPVPPASSNFENDRESSAAVENDVNHVEEQEIPDQNVDDEWE